MDGFWTYIQDGVRNVSGKVNDVRTDVPSEKIRTIVFDSVVSTCAQGHLEH